jgi:type III restriction enzyme
VPFTFLLQEGDVNGPPPPPKPKTRIEPLKSKESFAISWPNVIRIDHVYRPRLDLDWDTVSVLTLNAADKIGNAEMAAVVAGKPHLAVMSDIDLQALAEWFRLQRIIFEVTRDVFDQMQPTWKGVKENLLAQVIRLVERFIASPKLQINPALFYEDELKRRIMLMLNMRRIVQHVFEQIRFGNTETLALVFDGNKPIRPTGDMLPWYTGKPCVQADSSHINFCVEDSTWEAKAAYDLDHSPVVKAWVKNDHLGFEVIYIFEGIIHKYRPDLLIRLANGAHLLLEIKGQDTPKDQTKQRYLAEWVDAVNTDGRFGQWQSASCRDPSSLPNVVADGRLAPAICVP